MSAGMRPVALDFGDRPSPARWLLGQARRGRPLAAGLLLCAAGALAAVAWTIWDTRQQLHAAQDGALALGTQRSRAARLGAMRVDRPALTPQQSRDFNQIVRQLNTPWPAILDTLEQNTPDTVALVAIEPDARNVSVRLQVEARTLDALLQYADGLRGSGPFDDVALHRHETNEQDANRPVRLSFDAGLKSGRAAAAGSSGGAR